MLADTGDLVKNEGEVHVVHRDPAGGDFPFTFQNVTLVQTDTAQTDKQTGRKTKDLCF